jgi:hypothetical protein
MLNLLWTFVLFIFGLLGVILKYAWIALVAIFYFILDSPKLALSIIGVIAMLASFFIFNQPIISGVLLGTAFVYAGYKGWEQYEARKNMQSDIPELDDDRMLPGEQVKHDLLVTVLQPVIASTAMYPDVAPPQTSYKIRGKGDTAAIMEQNRIEVDFANQEAKKAELQRMVAVRREATAACIKEFRDVGDYYRVKIETPIGLFDKQITDLSQKIESGLKLFKADPMDHDDEAGLVEMHLYHRKPSTDLEKITALTINDFFAKNPCIKDNPARDIFKIPLATSSNGKVWSLPMHHTLVVGRSGSGKGSPIQGIIRQLAPATPDENNPDDPIRGLVELILIDPKNAEGLGYETTSIFRKLASSLDDMVNAVREFHALMLEAKLTASRRNLVTKDKPMRVLIIDEFPSLKAMKVFMEAEDEDEMTVESMLITIMAQGRSLNHFVVMASQAATDKAIGSYRINMANKISLSNESNYEVTWLLGKDAMDTGKVTHPIPISNEDNNYVTAGIANVQGDDNSIELVRFAYTSDEEIASLQEEYALSEASLALVQQMKVNPSASSVPAYSRNYPSQPTKPSMNGAGTTPVATRSQTAIAMRKEQEEQDRLDQEELDALADEYGDEI